MAQEQEKIPLPGVQKAQFLGCVAVSQKSTRKNTVNLVWLKLLHGFLE
jgi:hypothetical protein